MRISVVVCTRNRPVEMMTLAGSLVGQTRLPDEVIIVDSGTKSGLDEKLRSLPVAAQSYSYVRSKPGLTIQRNVGIAASTGDIIQFFDDDVVLEQNYLEAVERAYLSDLSHSIFAVEGRITNLPREPAGSLVTHEGGFRGGLSRAARRVFLLPDQGDGRVKLSGCPSMANWGDQPGFVEMLSGCCFSFRREVFDRVTFDEVLAGYCSGEDLDISRQLSRLGMGAYYCPDARLEHRSHGFSTYGAYERAKDAFRNRAYFLHKHSSGRLADRIAFWWSNVGVGGLELAHGSLDGAIGLAVGICDELRGSTSENHLCTPRGEALSMTGRKRPGARCEDETIVCTRNRTQDVDRFLRMYAAVRDAPRLLIVDSSDDDSVRAMVKVLTADLSLAEVRYVHCCAGLARQRMYGVSLLSDDTEVVHFLDDDTVLEADYFMRIRECFQADSLVLGACGRITSMPAYAPHWADRLFLLAGSRAGEVMSSGVGVRHFDVGESTSAGNSPVAWLPGCCMSFRVSVFKRLSFDTRMQGYSLGEDLDFSFRAGLLGPLVAVSEARLEHLCSAANRGDAYSLGRQSLVFRHQWVSEMRGHGPRLVAFWWSCAGQGLRCAVDVVKRGPNARVRARNFALALRDIAGTGRIARNDRIGIAESPWS